MPPAAELTPVAADEGRSARKRRAIMEAATELFLHNGYAGTSMDQVAARAAVSKQTVYKHFADKETLFAEIVRDVTGNAEQIVTRLTAALDAHADQGIEAALTAVTRSYLDGVLQPHVLRLRRLVIAVADRFPDLARDYYVAAPARGIELLADALEQYADKGAVHLPDPHLAASHLAYLALAIPQDHAMFCPDQTPTPAERDTICHEAVRVFLAAYAKPERSPVRSRTR